MSGNLPDYSYVYKSAGYNNDVADINTTDYSTLTGIDYSDLTKDVANITNKNRTSIDMNTKTTYSDPLKPPSDTGFTSADVKPVVPIKPLELPEWKIPEIEIPKEYVPNSGSGSEGGSGSGSGSNGENGSDSGSKKSESSFNIKFILIFLLFIIIIGGAGAYFYTVNKRNKLNKLNNSNGLLNLVYKI